jgi:hypothetical protein
VALLTVDIGINSFDSLIDLVLEHFALGLVFSMPMSSGTTSLTFGVSTTTLLVPLAKDSCMTVDVTGKSIVDLIDAVFVSSSNLLCTGAKFLDSEAPAKNADLASEPNEALLLADSKDNVNS